MHLGDQLLEPFGAFEFERVMSIHGLQLAHHRIIAPITITLDKGQLGIRR
jgi:hypothetical protein